jgi:hypothetical protein
MSDGALWGWPALAVLGAYHGINPGMGWLFAVALGIQEGTSRAVWRALIPIAAGHGLAIGAVVVPVWMVQAAVPAKTLKLVVALTLLAFGLYRVLRARHPRWGGMQVGFGHLTMWSFLVASVHGAGLMVLPVLLGMTKCAPHGGLAATHHHQAGMLGGPWIGLTATLIHTSVYLLVTGLTAWAVYAKLGLAILRTAWLNLDLIWALALMATGAFTLLL